MRPAIVAALTIASLSIVGVAVALAAFTGTTTNAASSFTADTSFPPVLQSGPDLEQTAQVGATLSVSTGDWSPPGTSYTYRWLRCDAAGANCAVVAGQAASTYALVAGDANSTFAAEVTALRGNKSAVSTTELSQSTRAAGGSVITGANAAAVSANMPAISGTTTIGSTLSVSTGTWTLTLQSFTYQWLRCDATGLSCATIASATGTTYALVAADQGRRLRVRVTCTVLGLSPNWVLTRDSAVIA